MHSIVDWLRRHFLMNRRELYGMILLSILLGLWLSSSYLSAYFFNSSTLPLSPPQLDSLAAHLSPPPDSTKQTQKKQSNTISTERFTFDPNTATLADWQRMGVPDWLANRILRYRAKGGYFHQPTDLQKIYGFPPALYQSIAPYIRIEPIPQEEPNQNYSQPARIEKKSNPHPESFVVELNTADTTALKRLPGIGSTYARRILAYRDLLGGFYSVEQLKEVYGLSEETYQRILPFVTINPHHLRLLPINQIDAQTLARHPYLTQRKAQAIVAYRTQHGNFRTIEDLKKIKALNPKEVERLAPYLSF